jgi:16S rRNA (uracil1498-N3)-methyltransferase
LFVAAELREGTELAASAEHAHYLGTVLRCGSGDLVRLFNGADGEWTGRITVSRRDRVTVAVGQQSRDQQPETGPWLIFALLKRDATDLVVRQAVELGASRVLPVITERTNAARVNLDRLRAIAIEAAEQSERLTIPVIDPPARLDAVLAAWPAGRRLFVALERSWPAAPDAVGRPVNSGQREATGIPVSQDHSRQREAIGIPAGPGHSLQPEGSEIPASQDHRHQVAGTRTPSGPDVPLQHGVAETPVRPNRDPEQAALLVGPEGGFTPAERAFLSRLDFVAPISLGPFVLRAETAAASGQALLLAMGWADYVPATL